MAFRTIRREITIRFDETGEFEYSYQFGVRQAIENGEVLEKPRPQEFLSLAEVKALVASL